MNRCLDCGAERETDQCAACGLTSAAAEVMLRRRLVRRTALFLVGAIIFVTASQGFPPLEEDGILIFWGGVFFVVRGRGVVEGEAREPRRGDRSRKAHLFWVPAGAV